MPGITLQLLTLRLSKFTLLNAGLDGLVELAIERGLGQGDFVVGKDVLLQRLPAV